MKSRNRLTLAAAIVVSSNIVLGGCTTTPHRHVHYSDETKATTPRTTIVRTRADAPAPTNRTTATPSDVDDSSIAFTSPAADPRMNSRPHTDRDQTTALIGLYGEVVSGNHGREAGAQLDGANNLTQVSFATEGSCIDPDIDRTGTQMVFASTMHRATADIYIKSVNGKTCTQLTADPADDVMPCFSPDGKTIAFSSKRSGNWDIYTIAVSGGRPVQITSDNDPELHPTWSPDGKTLAYCKFGSQSSRWEIWTVDVANPAAPRFLEYGVFPKWNPDPACNKILFQRAKQRGSRDYSIWTIDCVNGQAINPTEIVSAANAALINPAWSADGSKIVFVSVVDPDTETGSTPSQSDLWVVNLDGTDRTNLTNGKFANYQPVWASDGSVYFVSNRSGVDNIWAVATRTNGTPGFNASTTKGVASAEAQNPPAENSH